MKSIKYILLGLALGILAAYLFYSNQTLKDEVEDSEVIIERIKSVKKLVVTEGYFSELYSYKEADKYFYDLIEFEKKALLLVKGRASVTYNLEEMDYQVDKENKTITLVNVPAPIISVEPEIKYFDLTESTFNSFSTTDYNKLNSRAILKLKQKVEKSKLKSIARNELETTLNDIQWVGKELGWKVVFPKT